MPVEIAATARVAANDLIHVSDEHEQRAHGGEACMPNRASIVAFVAHSLGLSGHDMLDVALLIGDYEDGHGHTHA
jgi:hypothetical protein